MKKILYVIDSMRAGGKERDLTEILKVVTQKDYQCELITFAKDIFYREILGLPIKIHYYEPKKESKIQLIKLYYRVFHDFHPDYVHVWNHSMAVQIVPFALLFKAKIINSMIVNAPDTIPFGSLLWRCAKFSFLFSHQITGNSKAGLSVYKAPKRKSHIIYNGFDETRLKSLPDPLSVRDELQIKTPYVIGMVASFTVNKDYKTYLEAAKIILSQRLDVTFLAIGDGPFLPDYKKAYSDCYPGRILFLGKVHPVEKVVQLFDIGVLSTYTEGISNSIMEKLALSKPVIATRGGGTEEIVRPNYSGILIPPRDISALVNAILLLLDNPELRIQLGRNGAKLIQKEFSLQARIAYFEKLYKS